MSKLPDSTTFPETFPPADPTGNGSHPPGLPGPLTTGSSGHRVVPGRAAARSVRAYWWGGLGTLLVLAGGVAYFAARGDRARADVLTHTVKKEVLQITVTEKGTVESSANRDLICKVRAKGQGQGFATSIKDVVPDGTRVKPGDILMTLDDSALKEQEDTQKITVKQKQADAVKAEKDYLICKEETEGKVATQRDAVANARIDLEKYTGTTSDPARAPLGAVAGATATLVEKGEFRQTLDDLNGQIALAQANVEQNRERSDWAQRMVKQSYMAPAQAQSEKSRLDSSVEDLRSKQAKRDQLINYDRRKQLTTFRGAHDGAVRLLRQYELEAEAKQATAKTAWDTALDILAQEKDRLADILAQREECVVRAPADIKPDSMVVYFKQENNRFNSSSQGMIEQGAQVKESQKMLRIPNLGEMQVQTKIHEAMVSRIKIGQRALVRAESMADRQFVGTVKWVSAVANQDSWAPDVKLYPTIVRIEGELGPDGKVIPLVGEHLKPDMTAEVTIGVDAVKEPVPTIPLQAVIGGAEMGATRDIFVKVGDKYDRRPVVLGLFNEKMVEIRSGLKEGEEVVTNPKVLLGDKEKVKTRDGTEPRLESEKTEPKSPAGPPAGPTGPGGYDPTKGGAGGPGGGLKGGGPGGGKGGGGKGKGGKGDGPPAGFPTGGGKGDGPGKATGTTG